MQEHEYCGEAQYLQGLSGRLTNDHSLFDVVLRLNRHFREGTRPALS